jgi:hypothetical protein
MLAIEEVAEWEWTDEKNQDVQAKTAVLTYLSQFHPVYFHNAQGMTGTPRPITRQRGLRNALVSSRKESVEGDVHDEIWARGTIDLLAQAAP